MSDQPNLYVEDTGGEGAPVVLIHGWPLSGAAWEAQVPALLAASLRVITYDRRGFGRSDKPQSGFDYDQLAADLNNILTEKDLHDVTLVGFSMGGGEAVRYVSRFGEDRLRAIVLAAAVPPFMMKGPDNPDGPLTPEAAAEMKENLIADRDAFFDGFTKDFYTANGTLAVDEAERAKAIALCQQSDQTAALGCMKAFGTTDFREDLKKITVPVLILHGDADGIVPFEGSGARSSDAIAQAEVALIPGAPHGLNVSHADAFNTALVNFISKSAA